MISVFHKQNKYIFRGIIYIVFFVLETTFLFGQKAFSIPEPNPNEKIFPINDYSGILSEQEKYTLNKKLIDYSSKTSTQILVITTPTLGGDDINYVAARWGEKWKIGTKKNNGVVVLIANEDRKMAIQAGRGTEDLLTDYQSSNIIQNYFIPSIKQNNYYQAIDLGTDAIIATLAGKFVNDEPKSSDDDYAGIIFLAIFILIIIIIISKGNSPGSGNYDDRDEDVLIDRRGRRIYNGGGWFGGFPIGGGFSGGRDRDGDDGGFGGFGGFGDGGSFGGGGSSGSW